MAKSTSTYLKVPALGKIKEKEKQAAFKIKKQASPPKPNKFMGMSDAAIKKLYVGMSQAEKKANGIAMAKASQANKAKKRNTKPTAKSTFTKAVKSASTGTTPSNTKAQKAISGVGPSSAQRRKDSSPEAMAAYDKRAKAVDGPGPSRAERIKAMSATAMAAVDKKNNPVKKKFPSGRVALAARQAEKNKTRSFKDPRSETRTRYVRSPGGGTRKVYEIKVKGKWVKAGGKG